MKDAAAQDHRHCSVRLKADQFARLDRIARERGRSASDLIRDAIDVWLDRETLLGERERRLARLTEFTQVAVDVMIREQFPELRDRIIAETDRRMAAHHD